MLDLVPRGHLRKKGHPDPNNSPAESVRKSASARIVYVLGGHGSLKCTLQENRPVGVQVSNFVYSRRLPDGGLADGGLVI